jgi:hypothetical protein
MTDINFLAVILTAVAAVVVSTVWYIIFANPYAASLQVFTSQPADDQARPPAWKVVVELVRSLVLATGVAILIRELGLSTAVQGLALGLGLWIMFPVVLLAGSVAWDGAPIRLAAVHAGDWGIKLILVATALAIWS